MSVNLLAPAPLRLLGPLTSPFSDDASNTASEPISLGGAMSVFKAVGALLSLQESAVSPSPPVLKWIPCNTQPSQGLSRKHGKDTIPEGYGAALRDSLRRRPLIFDAEKYEFLNCRWLLEKFIKTIGLNRNTDLMAYVRHRETRTLLVVFVYALARRLKRPMTYLRPLIDSGFTQITFKPTGPCIYKTALSPLLAITEGFCKTRAQYETLASRILAFYIEPNHLCYSRALCQRLPTSLACLAIPSMPERFPETSYTKKD